MSEHVPGPDEEESEPPNVIENVTRVGQKDAKPKRRSEVDAEERSERED